MSASPKARAVLLALLSVLLYLPSLDAGFLRWDDQSLILEDPVAALPLGQAVREAFSRPVGMTYWPLREVSYALDHALWGFNPFGFHLTNLLLYAVATALLYAAARRLVGEGAAFLGASLFAVHPLHAEAVAWASGRKDLLCGAWLLAAWWVLGLPAGERTGPRLLRLLGGLACYTAACLSKTVALPFPLVWWAQDRIWTAPDRRWGWMERIPFLGVMGLLGGVQLAFSLGSGAAGRYLPDAAGIRQALATPLRALLEQLAALSLPLGLSPVYPPRSGSWGWEPWMTWGLGLAVAALLARALWQARGAPLGPTVRGLMFGQAWTLLFLLPVINLGVATSTPRADRYAFLPSAGFCLAAATALAAWCGGSRARRLLAGTLVACWAVLSFSQGGAWRDDPALWRGALRRYPDSFLASGGLAWGYADRGRLAPARRALERMVRSDPASPLGHHQLGGFLKETGELPHALIEYGEAARLYEETAKGRTGVRVPSGYRREHAQCRLELGSLLMALGRPDSAVAQAQAATGQDPSNPRAWAALGLWRCAAGDPEGALAACDRALALAPFLAEGHAHASLAARRIGEAAALRGEAARAEGAFSRALDECRWMLKAGRCDRALLSQLAYVLLRLSSLAEDPWKSRMRRGQAEEIYRSFPPQEAAEEDRMNLGALLRLKAADLAASGDLAGALRSLSEARGLRPGDAEIGAALEALEVRLRAEAP